MPRFVLLRHECPPNWEKPSHWDFMLEVGGVLWTWELRELPATWAQALGREMTACADRVPATKLADHRLGYLDYEGPVSGERGHVTRADRGEFAWLARPPEQVAIVLHGELIKSRATIAGSELSVEVG